MSATLVALLGLAAAMPLAEARIAFTARTDTAVTVRGPADPETGRALSLDDPARVASVSKLVVAIGVMRLVEQGRLDLDRDVSEVLGWRLRHPRHPREPITLRRLLSHHSGLADGINSVLPLDADLRATLADRRAWADESPGGYFRYANLNFPVIAAVMERATGERFDRLMRRLVLAPLRLDACYNWASCRPDVAPRAVVQVRGGEPVLDDHRGRPPACPVEPARDGSCDLRQWRAGRNGAVFSPQGGLRISVRDLARIGRMLLNGGMLDGRRVLRRSSVAVLARPLWRFDGRNGDTAGGMYCSYGLAVTFLPTAQEGCRDDLFGNGRARFGHAGSAYGLRAGLWLDLTAGSGVAYVATDVPADAGRSAFTAAEERLAAGGGAR